MVTEEKRLTSHDINALKKAYHAVFVYAINSNDYQSTSKAYDAFEGTFNKQANSHVPDYLQKRFTAVADAYNLTWTDAQFKDWWLNATEEEKDNYLFPINRRSIPVFDWEHKKVQLSDNTKRSDGKTPINPRDPSACQLGIDDMAYISYELLKRNVEYLIKDGADWGKFNISYMNDMQTRGIFVEVIDFIGYSPYQSFQMMVSGSNALARGDQFGYWGKMQYDDEIYVYKKSEVPLTNYVTQNTKMNMQLLHGIEMGQKVYDNYMQGYAHSMTVDRTTLNRFNTVIGGFNVEHIIANGYQIIYTK